MPHAVARMPLLLPILGLLFPAGPAALRAEDSPTVAARESAPAEADEPESPAYRLKYRFQPNQFVHYKEHQRVRNTARYKQVTETVRYEWTTHKHWRVSSVDGEGRAVLELMIDRVRMKAQFDQHDPIVWNSESPEPPPEKFRDVAATVGKPQVRLRVTPAGELESVVRLDNKAGSSQQPGAKRSRNFLVVFPDEPIRVGESWSDRYQVKVNVTRKLKKDVTLLRTYRLRSVEDGRATIGLNTSIVTAVNNPKVRAQLIQRTPSGTIEFDLKRGLIASRKLTVDRVVIGPFGAKSSLRAVSVREEELVQPAAAAAIARKPQGMQVQ